MGRLAWKNLFHDKVRLAVTLTGIIFALVLILIQFGLFLGFIETSSNVVAASGADLWISAPSIPHVNGGTPLLESKRYQMLALDGVDKVTKYGLYFIPWKLPSGAQESVQISGFELESGMGGPWNITAGSLADLRGEDTVIVDELYRDKLGITHLGQTVEINGHRARVVGYTRGIRSFTTAPYIYCSFKNAQNYIRLREQETIFFMVKVASGYTADQVKKNILDHLKDVDVYTNEEMRKKTMTYWVFGTGAGVTTLMGAALGLIVGIVVVAQTIYAATMDHIREFGTLKAMGATNGVIYQVIFTQAVLSGLMGYVVAIAIALVIAKGSEEGNALISVPPEMVVGTLGLSVVMCVLAAVISINKATRIDPAMVFRG